MERLSGAVEEIRFRNDENGYTVLVADCDGAPIIVVGNLPPISPGDVLDVEGEFTVHPKFGAQFKACRASVSPPATAYGIIKFLSSGLIEGCGEKTAARIVEKFGEKTVEILEKTPERLAEVKGVSKAKAQAFKKSFDAQRFRRDAVMFLSGYGITVNLAMKLCDVYGAATVSTVKSNPYVLVEDIDGVGFATADKIARSLGISERSPFRIRAGVLHALNNACEKEGNTYLPLDKLKAEALRLLGFDESDGADEVSEAVDMLRVERKLVTPFENAVMSERFYRTENAAAVKLVKRIDGAGENFADADSLIDRFQKINGITLHPAQRDAVINAVSHGVSVITGGPGTGKTTIINCILFILDMLGGKSLLLAPTGRAAKRITDGCGRDAFTIHRALMSLEQGDKFEQNTVIVDEFSMVDIFLFRMLLDAIADGARLIIVGDADQLPSVGSGNVLRDLISSGIAPVTRLSHIYRQSETGRIALSAHAINAGEVPDLGARDGDFFFFPVKTPERIADMTVELATERITAKFGIDPSRIQVIAALKNGVAGVNSLNARLQRSLNALGGKEIRIGDVTFREGDRVMHTVNNYELEWTRGAVSGSGVFNGDIGVVAAIMHTGEIEVEFEDGRRALYAGDTRRQLILSYAITVHKSQGCEFDAVVMPVVGGAPVMMTRNLLYTAITRAKKLAVLVGEEYNVKRMVENNYVAQRYSALAVFIDRAKADMRKLFGD